MASSIRESALSARSVLSAAVPLAVVLLSLAFGPAWQPYQRLLAATVALFFAFKAAALLRLSKEDIARMGSSGLAIYLLLWPGMDPAPFAAPRRFDVETGRRFSHGLTRLALGAGVLIALALSADKIAQGAISWLAISALLIAIHLGLSDMITDVVRTLGWRAQPLFESPFRSKNLSDFWTRKWNRPFVELNRIVFMPALTRFFGIRGAVFCAFLISGLLHEFAISYPAAAGWGGPFAYFALQGLLVLFERKFKVRGSLWAGFAVLAPLPLLFHAPFRRAFLLPLVSFLNGELMSIDPAVAVEWIAIALSLGQLLVLAASFQVPSRLRWKEELSKLSPFNRKLVWTYGGFIVYTILFWSVTTFLLRSEIVRGTSGGIAVCAGAFGFWLLRLAVDAFYFRSEDWPKGRFMQIGHAMLNALFVFLCLGYGALLVWQLFVA